MLDSYQAIWNREALRTLRLRLGWSRSDLARRLGCSSEMIESWEEGRSMVNAALNGELEIISRLAEACCDEVMYTPVAEAKLESTALAQIDFSMVKADFK